MGNANEGSSMTHHEALRAAAPAAPPPTARTVTQIDAARAGTVTREMEIVAQKEDRDPEFVREGVAAGRIAIPANIRHESLSPEGVGAGLRTKVNVNLGISGDLACEAEEWKKVDVALELGAEAIMDLSNSGKTAAFRRALIEKSPAMIGTVPMYDAIGYLEKPLIGITAADFLDVVRAHAEDGVDFVTIHAGMNRRVIESFRETGRLTNIVSRGGSLIFAWMEATGNENPFYEFYDEVLAILHEHDVTISLGDALRPGSTYDATDAAQIAELVEMGKLYEARVGCGRAGDGGGPRPHGTRRDSGEHEAGEAPVPRRALLRARAARLRHRAGLRPHHGRHRRGRGRRLGRGLPLLRDAGRASAPARCEPTCARASWPRRSPRMRPTSRKASPARASATTA